MMHGFVRHLPRFTRLGALILVLPVVAGVIPAAAQSSQGSSWGVVGSFAPQHDWQTLSQLEVIFKQEEDIDVAGSDFTIGIARGRMESGDWGVSYIRKRINDDSRLGAPRIECASNGCAELGSYQLTRGVSLSGIEAHKFVPLATIKNRVQIGLNFAGGIGKFKGVVDEYDLNGGLFQSGNGPVTVVQDATVVTPLPAETDLVQTKWFPLTKVQAAVGVIVAPGLKVRVAGGFDFPGYQVINVSAVYLFGRR